MRAGAEAPRGRDGITPWLRLHGRKVAVLLTQDTSIVVGSVIAANLLRVVSSIVLTRLLTPEVFGAVGIIGSIAFVLAMVSDLGFQAFVVRHARGDDPAFLDAVWTIRLIRAVALTVLLLILAEPIAVVLGKPELTGLIAVSALFFLVEGLSSLSLLTALRHGLLMRLSLMELGVAVLQIAVSIALAAWWHDAWSIVVAILIGGCVKTIASYRVFPGTGRRWWPDRACSAELWAFARFVTGSSIISMVLMQADKVVLARILSLGDLGLYILAGNLALAPLAFTSAYGSRVLYPMFARVWRERPGALRAIYYSGRRRGSIAYMVGAGGLIGVAPLLVQLLYDDRYAGAATYLRLLAIAPLFNLGTVAANEALTASGHVRTTFHLSLVKLVWLAIAAPAGFAWFGPIGLVAAVATTEAAAAVYAWAALYRIGLFQAGEEALLLLAAGIGIAAGCLTNAKLGGWIGTVIG